MKNKRLRIGRLIIANLLIITICVFLLFVTPDTPEINFTIAFMYVLIATLFNLFVTER